MITFLLYLYLRLVAVTSRIQVIPDDENALLMLKEDRAVVFSFWFQHILFLLYFFSSKSLPILMTPRRKTDWITKLSQCFGFKVAISSLESGGRHALVSLIDALKKNSPVLIPADSSRGPHGLSKASCFIVAQENCSPIIPVSWKANLKITIPRSTGPIIVPLPFSKIKVRLGVPILIVRQYQIEELDELKRQLQAALNQLA